MQASITSIFVEGWWKSVDFQVENYLHGLQDIKIHRMTWRRNGQHLSFNPPGIDLLDLPSAPSPLSNSPVSGRGGGEGYFTDDLFLNSISI